MTVYAAASRLAVKPQWRDAVVRRRMMTGPAGGAPDGDGESRIGDGPEAMEQSVMPSQGEHNFGLSPPAVLCVVLPGV